MTYSGDTFPSPKALGERARFRAMVLAGQRPINRGATEWFMRAFACLYTPSYSNGITNEIYSSMPVSARIASRLCASECAQYFEQTGVIDEMTRDLPTIYPNGKGDADIDGWMIKKMQVHVSTMGTPGVDKYYDRALKQMRKISPARIPFNMLSIDLGSFKDDFSDRREELLRGVIDSFGTNFGPVLEGYVLVVPEPDSLGVIRYADEHIA